MANGFKTSSSLACAWFSDILKEAVCLWMHLFSSSSIFLLSSSARFQSFQCIHDITAPLMVGEKLYLKLYTCISLCGTDLEAHCRTLLKLFHQLDIVGRLCLLVAAQFRVPLEDWDDPKQLLSHPGWLSAFGKANHPKEVPYSRKKSGLKPVWSILLLKAAL